MLPLMSRRFEVLDPWLQLQIPPCRFSLSVFACTRVRGNVTQLQRERARLLRWRFAETSRQSLQTNGENKLQHSVIITREEQEGGGGGTKDVPGLSLYTSPPSFHWLMAHKWKQTLKEKMKNTLYLTPSALPGDPAQTLLCCQRNGLPLSLQIDVLHTQRMRAMQ